MRNHNPLFSFIKLTLVLSFFAVGLIGCAEQPLGYIYRPTQSDEVTLARTATDVISSIYDHMDLATRLLEDASRTNRWDTILPPGWVEGYDMDLGLMYFHNYLDQKYEFLLIDKDPLPGAVRTPSDIEYRYMELRNFLNTRTWEYYIDIYERSTLKIEYADDENPGDRRDPYNVQGWLDITRALPFEETIVFDDYEYDYTYYEYPTWVLHIENFSIDPSDHRARIQIEGTLPHRDETEKYREDHVTGKIVIHADGTGSGELSLYGEPVVIIHFLNRGAGFTGYFTLHSQDHDQRHTFTPSS